MVKITLSTTTQLFAAFIYAHWPAAKRKLCQAYEKLEVCIQIYIDAFV